MDSKVSLNLIKHWQELCNDIVFVDIAPLLIQNRIITLSDYENIKSAQTDKAETESLLLRLLKKDESVLLKFAEVLETDYSWLAHKIREGYAPEHGSDETDATPIMHVTSPPERSDNDTIAEEETHSNMTAITRNNCLNNRVSNRCGKWGTRKSIKCRVKNRLRNKVPNLEQIISSSTDLMEQQQQQQNEEITDEVLDILRMNSLLSNNWTTIAHSLGLTDKVNEIRFRVILYNEHLSLCLVYLIKAWMEMFPQKATLSRLIQVLRKEKFNKAADDLSEKLWSKPVAVSNHMQ